MKRTHSYGTGCRSIAVSAMLAACIAFMPASASAQAFGVATDLSPSSFGDMHRASRMLLTGNPQGTSDQLSDCLPDFSGFEPQAKAEWLAMKGAALFEEGNPECLEYLSKVADKYPTSAYAANATLTIGDWHWHHSEWHEALASYDKTDINSLAPAQRQLYTFRKGLAYLKCGVPEMAMPLLATLEGSKEYGLAARYYIGYALYSQKDYDKAYSILKQVAEEMAGAPVKASADEPASDLSESAANTRGRKRGSAASPTLVPARKAYQSDGIEPLYYMAQIDYLRGQYDDVISLANTLMAKTPVDEFLPELHRIAGLSHFKTGDNISARPHLEEYVRSAETPNDDALYALGATEYAAGDLDSAETHLRGLTDRNNDIAQGAYLYLGQIAERRGDMNTAAMAFDKASAMAYDAKVAETALYNYIVASGKGGKVPFSSSITMLENFLNKYPQSPYASDVEESLAGAYFHERDYAKALAAINRIKNPSEATKATKQKILYNLGTSEISAGHYADAITALKEASDMTADKALATESRVWLGEALYRSADYKQAATAYRTALKDNPKGETKLSALYGLAYSEFQMQQWSAAQADFAKVAEASGSNTAVRSDALLREADCLHYLGQHAKAGEIYAKVMSGTSGDTDYAAFRHAVTTGLTAGADAKMKEIDAFLRDRADSKWTPEALLEGGNTWAALDRPDKAASYFQRLTKEYPKDAKSRKGALALALAYVRQGHNASAEAVCRGIISTWPTSEEASLANDEMRRIVASDGRLAEYAQFLSGIKGAPQITPDEMDAITFEAAETAYADNPDATELLEKYVKEYPEGRHLAQALMDLAEAADNSGNSKLALKYLDQLLWMRDDSAQAPGALYLQAQLLEDSGENGKALESYLKLEQRGGAEFAPEATAGVMRNTSDPDQRTAYARRLLAMGGAEAIDSDEARYYEASGLMHGSDSATGVAALKDLAANPTTLSGAKAAVDLGEWYLANGNSKEALAVLEKFTDAGSPHAYWLARGFIALADAYHAQGNDYLAAEYLKSLRDNYPGDEDDIRDAINSKISKYSKQ